MELGRISGEWPDLEAEAGWNQQCGALTADATLPSRLCTQQEFAIQVRLAQVPPHKPYSYQSHSDYAVENTLHTYTYAQRQGRRITEGGEKGAQESKPPFSTIKPAVLQESTAVPRRTGAEQFSKSPSAPQQPPGGGRRGVQEWPTTAVSVRMCASREEVPSRDVSNSGHITASKRFARGRRG